MHTVPAEVGVLLEKSVFSVTRRFGGKRRKARLATSNWVFLLTHAYAEDISCIGSLHHVHWDHLNESLCLHLESRPMPGKDHLALVPLLPGTACHYQFVYPLQLQPSGNVSRHIFLTWPFPIDTGIPNDLLTLWNYFNYFAVDHWLDVAPLSLATPGILAL